MEQNEKREMLEQVADLLGGVFVDSPSGGYIKVKERILFYVRKTNEWKFYKEEDKDQLPARTVPNLDKVVYFFGLGAWRDYATNSAKRAIEKGISGNDAIVEFVLSEYPNLNEYQQTFLKRLLEKGQLI